MRSCFDRHCTNNIECRSILDRTPLCQLLQLCGGCKWVKLLSAAKLEFFGIVGRLMHCTNMCGLVPLPLRGKKVLFDMT